MRIHDSCQRQRAAGSDSGSARHARVVTLPLLLLLLQLHLLLLQELLARVALPSVFPQGGRERVLFLHSFRLAASPSPLDHFSASLRLGLLLLLLLLLALRILLSLAFPLCDKGAGADEGTGEVRDGHRLYTRAP